MTRRSTEAIDRLIFRALKDGPLTINKLHLATGISHPNMASYVKLRIASGVLVHVGDERSDRGRSAIYGMPGQRIGTDGKVKEKAGRSGVIAPAPYATGFRWGFRY